MDASTIKTQEIEKTRKEKKLEEIQGQYIGLMKFSNNGVNILKDFYHKCKKISETNPNPLNANLPFKKC